CALRISVCEQIGKVDSSRRVSALHERHRADDHTPEAPGTAVARDIVCRSSRSGQDELPGPPPLVDSMPNCVPYARCELPFIDKARDVAGKHERWRYLGEICKFGFCVEPDRARHVL